MPGGRFDARQSFEKNPLRLRVSDDAEEALTESMDNKGKKSRHG
jgi:hypothetical protein